MSDDARMRPAQVIYLGALFLLFGLEPLGYHFVNAVVTLIGVITLYASLRAANISRLVSVSVPLLFATAPNFSAARFWYASFQANLSVTLYLLSFLFMMTSLRCRSSLFYLLAAAAVITLILSVLAYEVTAPLFLFNIAVTYSFVHRGRKRVDQGVSRRRTIVAFSSILTAFIATIIFKALTTTRLASGPVTLAHFTEIWAKAFAAIDLEKYDYGLNFQQAFAVNFGELWLGLPFIVVKVIENYHDTTSLFVGSGAFFTTCAYLLRLVPRSPHIKRFSSEFARLILTGMIFFVLGYAIFLTNSNLLISATGIGNRTAVAATLGVAMTITGLAGYLSYCLLKPVYFRFAYSFSVALICAFYMVTLNAIAFRWIYSYQLQEEIVGRLEGKIAEIPEGGTLILDGVCPYIGPAIVFEASWDLKGRLNIIGARGINADVVTRRMTIGESGIDTNIYGNAIHYDFGSLYVYDFTLDRMQRLNDFEAAKRYFDKYENGLGGNCPEGITGHGVDMF